MLVTNHWPEGLYFCTGTIPYFASSLADGQRAMSEGLNERKYIKVGSGEVYIRNTDLLCLIKEVEKYGEACSSYTDSTKRQRCCSLNTRCWGGVRLAGIVNQHSLLVSFATSETCTLYYTGCTESNDAVVSWDMNQLLRRAGDEITLYANEVSSHTEYGQLRMLSNLITNILADITLSRWATPYLYLDR